VLRVSGKTDRQGLDRVTFVAGTLDGVVPDTVVLGLPVAWSVPAPIAPPTGMRPGGRRCLGTRPVDDIGVLS